MFKTYGRQIAFANYPVELRDGDSSRRASAPPNGSYARRIARRPTDVLYADASLIPRGLEFDRLVVTWTAIAMNKSDN